MGRVLAAYGVKGWVKVEPFTGEADALARYRTWWLGKQGEWNEVAVAETARHGRHIVARFEGCVVPEEAVRFRGREIAVPREALPATAADEMYETDLLGLRVVNGSGEELGTVEGVLDNGVHRVLQVRWQGGQRLVPFLAHVVESIDLAAGELRVDWGADW
jgi:16S rRNA processing protein RimM